MMHIKTITIIILSVCLSSELHAEKQIPSYVHLCNRNIPNLDECFTNTWREIYIKLTSEALPEMNLIGIDPYIIEKLELNFGNSSSISFNALATDIKLLGFKNGYLNRGNISLERLEFSIDYKLPALYIEANYKAVGKALLLTFNSTGTFNGNFSDIVIIGTWKGKSYMKNGKEYLHFNDTDMQLTMKSMKVNLSNLFPNNEELTQRTNEALNENVDVLYEEIKPFAVKTIDTIICDGLNKVYGRFSMDQLYPS